jgi:hypothetical protein
MASVAALKCPNPQCGSDVDLGSTFCMVCGTRLS